MRTRGRHFEERGEAHEAQAALDEALRLDPNSWEAHSTAAQLAFRKGDVAGAAVQFERAVAASDKDHSSASMLVTCNRARGIDVRHAAEIAVARAEGFVICDPVNGSAFASAARGLAALERA